MKKCVCGSLKWRTTVDWDKHVVVFQCLKCYKKYTKGQIRKLKDVEDE